MTSCYECSTKLFSTLEYSFEDILFTYPQFHGHSYLNQEQSISYSLWGENFVVCISAIFCQTLDPQHTIMTVEETPHFLLPSPIIWLLQLPSGCFSFHSKVTIIVQPWSPQAQPGLKQQPHKVSTAIAFAFYCLSLLHQLHTSWCATQIK